MSDQPQTAWAWWNGEFLPLADVRVAATDRAYLFGDAAYEVIRVYSGLPWLMKEHQLRLAASLAALGIDASLAGFGDRVASLLERSGATDACVYVQISRGSAPRSHVPPAGMKASELIHLLDVSLPNLAEKCRVGISACLLPDLRWGRCDIKSVNLLGNTLAASEARAKGFDEAVLVDRDGLVTEGTHSSFFAVLGGELHTTPLGPAILPGITRAFLLEEARKTGLAVRERRVAAAELTTASELFLCGTLSEIVPIVKLGGAPVGAAAPGPLTVRLQQVLKAALTKKNR